MIDLKLLVPAGAGLLLSFSTTADRIAFAPESGLTVTRTIENRLTLDLEDFAMDVDGQDMTAMMGGIPEVSFTNTNSVVVTDEFVEMAEGRPAKLKRTYDTIGNHVLVDASMMGEGQTDETEMSSELEGAEVVFTWDTESGEFVASYADEEDSRDPELLEGLSEDMDLRMLLPGREVEVGESWDIPFDALFSMLLPGGNLGAQPDGMDEMDADMDMGQMEDLMRELMDEYADAAESLFDGERKATYQGMREVDGEKLAVISLVIDTDGTLDFADMILDMMDRMGEISEMPMEMDMSIAAADLLMTVEGEGELLWDARRGIFRSMEMEAEMSIGVEMAMDMDMGGQATTMDITVELFGDLESSFVAE